MLLLSGKPEVIFRLL